MRSEPFTEVVEWGFGDSSLRHAAATAQGTEAKLARGGDPSSSVGLKLGSKRTTSKSTFPQVCLHFVFKVGKLSLEFAATATIVAISGLLPTAGIFQNLASVSGASYSQFPSLVHGKFSARTPKPKQN